MSGSGFGCGSVHCYGCGYHYAQTFAALSAVVDIASGAIATRHGSHRVDAFAFVVTAAIVFQAVVNV